MAVESRWTRASRAAARLNSAAAAASCSSRCDRVARCARGTRVRVIPAALELKNRRLARRAPVVAIVPAASADTDTTTPGLPT